MNRWRSNGHHLGAAAQGHQRMDSGEENLPITQKKAEENERPAMVSSPEDSGPVEWKQSRRNVEERQDASGSINGSPGTALGSKCSVIRLESPATRGDPGLQFMPVAGVPTREGQLGMLHSETVRCRGKIGITAKPVRRKPPQSLGDRGTHQFESPRFGQKETGKFIVSVTGEKSHGPFPVPRGWASNDSGSPAPDFRVRRGHAQTPARWFHSTTHRKILLPRT